MNASTVPAIQTGCRGDAIPLLAQVIGIVDVYDALTTARPYKESASRGTSVRCPARRGLGRDGGRQDLVEMFIRTTADGVLIVKKGDPAMFQRHHCQFRCQCRSHESGRRASSPLSATGLVVGVVVAVTYARPGCALHQSALLPVRNYAFDVWIAAATPASWIASVKKQLGPRRWNRGHIVCHWSVGFARSRSRGGRRFGPKLDTGFRSGHRRDLRLRRGEESFEASNLNGFSQTVDRLCRGHCRRCRQERYEPVKACQFR